MIPISALRNLLQATKEKFQRNRYLTDLIHKERRSLKLKDRIVLIFKELYIPSLSSFLVSALAVAILFFVAHLCPTPLDQDKNHFQNLIAIHAGIGTIIFALIVFIAESFREDTQKGQVLLKESYLFPLTVAEILTFFIFIWWEINIWSVLPIIAIGLFTIFSLSRIISIFLNTYEFERKKIELITNRVGKSIDLIIDERIGNNILLKLNERGIKLTFSPLLGSEKHRSFHYFYAPKEGMIEDIDLKILAKIAAIIDREGEERGMSFTEGERRDLEVGRGIMAQEPRAKKFLKNDRRYLLKGFHDVIAETEDERALICIDKNLIQNEGILEELESLVKRAFIVKRADNFAMEVRYEISHLKDKTIEAIRARQVGKLEELINFYTEIAKGFLERITKFGGGFSAEQARAERGAFFYEWKQVRWLSSDVSELLEEAMQTKNQTVIRRVAYLPIRIARNAVEQDDHYLFQEFIQFVQLLYRYASKEKVQEIKDGLTELSWRWLKEVVNFHIERELRDKSQSKQRIESLKNFGIYSFVIYQSLLKSAFDNGDQKAFEAFRQATNDLFDHFHPSTESQNAEHLSWLLENDTLTQEQRREIEAVQEKQKELEGVEEDLRGKRDQMFFGLASWILERLRQRRTDDGIKLFYNIIQRSLPTSIETLTSSFLAAHEYTISDFWGWDQWEEWPEGQVHSIRTLERLEQLYAVRGLTLLAKKNDEQIEKIELPHNRDLAFLAEGTRELIQTLNNIEEDPKSWSFILSSAALARVNDFRELLKKAKTQEDEDARKRKKVMQISNEKVEEFKKTFLESFYEIAVLRNVFITYLKKYVDETRGLATELEKGKGFGINIVDDKAIFLDNWHVHYVGGGGHFGNDLAMGENSKIFDEVAERCEEIGIEELRQKLELFEKNEALENIAIWLTTRSLRNFLEIFKEFQPKWSVEAADAIDVKGFGGWYKFKEHKIPVFEIPHYKEAELALVLNKDRIGELVQLSPINNEKEERRDIFCMNIGGFSQNKEMLNEFLSDPPDWLQKIGDRDAQREYLLERVRIQIIERFIFKAADNFEGYKMRVERKTK